MAIISQLDKISIFSEAKKIRKVIFADTAFDLPAFEFDRLAGKLEGLELAIANLGLMMEYYSFLKL